jgi:hypothetical protein
MVFRKRALSMTCSIMIMALFMKLSIMTFNITTLCKTAFRQQAQSMSCNIMMLSITTLYETQHNAISFMPLSKMAFRKLALSMIFSIIGLSIATINKIIYMLYST